MKKVLFSIMVCFLCLGMGISNVGAKKEKVIYLTFDDGPSKNTPKVLKILDQYKVKATFFVTGNGGKYTKYIGEAFNAGHKIGAHTYTHNYKIYKSKKSYYKDLNKIQNLIVKQTGQKTDIIRFPGGSSNTVSRHYKKGIMKKLTKDVRKKGYQYFDWNVSSGDAASVNPKTSRIVKNAKKGKSKNTIVLLMHDSKPKTHTVKALPKIIKYYKKKGYVFKTLDINSYAAHHPVNN